MLSENLVTLFCKTASAEPKKKSIGAKLLGGTAAVAGTTVGSGIIGGVAMKGISDRKNPYGSPKAVANMAKEMGFGKHDVQFRSAPSPVMGAAPQGIGVHQNVGKDTMMKGMMSDNPQYIVGAPPAAHESSIAHELGHVKNHMQFGRTGRMLSLASRQAATLGALPTTFAAGYQDKPTWTPGLIQAGLSAPMLADEAGASIRAARHLVGKYGLGAGLRKSLPLVPAFGTYAAMAGAPLAVTALRKYFGKKPQPTTAPASV